MDLSSDIEEFGFLGRVLTLSLKSDEYHRDSQI